MDSGVELDHAHPAGAQTLEERRGGAETAEGFRRQGADAARARGGERGRPVGDGCLERIQGDNIKGRVRLVKGSHIIVPKVHAQRHALILQNPDKRVVFVIPYEHQFSLIGTTDVPVPNVAAAERITARRPTTCGGGEPLPRQAAHARRRGLELTPGVRPLYDDGTDNPSEVTRDYVLKVDHEHAQGAAAHGVRRQDHHLPAAGRAGDGEARTVLPGLQGRPGPRARCCPAAMSPTSTPSATRCRRRYPELGRDLVEGVARRHGSRAARSWARRRGRGPGRNFGGGLSEREVEYLRRPTNGRARAEDVLWRRTKCGLHMTPSSAQRSAPVIAGSGAARMKPLADFPLADRGAIRGVFADIDDTLTPARAAARASPMPRWSGCAPRACS